MSLLEMERVAVTVRVRVRVRVRIGLTGACFNQRGVSVRVTARFVVWITGSTA